MKRNEPTGIEVTRSRFMVRTNQLTKHFEDGKAGKVHAVQSVTLEAKPGQVTGILGVNGAGKTTLLRMLSTVLTPTSGNAEVAGYDVQTHPTEVRRSIGFMSNSTALYGRLTAREMVRFFGELYGLSGESLTKSMNTIMERLDMGSFADRLCDKLSTGQKQRVSIARTVLHNPPVLFFDEPTAGLDVVSSQTVMQFIEEMRGEGKTVVYCTHIMSEVERLCDRVFVVHNGELKGDGTVNELREQTGETSIERAFLTLVGELQPAGGAR